MSDSELSYLDIYRNKIGSEGAASLAAALSRSNLSNLHVADNRIGSEGAASLAKALPSSKLNILKIWSNNIGDQGATVLLESIPQSALMELEVGLNNISARILKALSTAIEDNKLNIHNARGSAYLFLKLANTQNQVSEQIKRDHKFISGKKLSELTARAQLIYAEKTFSKLPSVLQDSVLLFKKGTTKEILKQFSAMNLATAASPSTQPINITNDNNHTQAGFCDRVSVFFKSRLGF